VASVIAGAPERKECSMPQMFDWIFFVIVILPSVYLVWDWFKNR
jgi:hypothetical protein